MDEYQPTPISLKIVAFLFMIEGLYSVITVVVAFMHGLILINLGVLGLLIGPGLLRCSNGWRICAFAYILFSLVSTLIIALILMANVPHDYNALGQYVVRTAQEYGLPMAAVVFLLSLWQLFVLTRPKIRMLFEIENG